MTDRRLALAVLLLLLGALPPGRLPAAGAEEVRWYRSNDQGMLLARVSPALKDQSEFVLKVTLDGTSQDRRLYDNGKEVRRWQVSWNSARTEMVERESQDGALRFRRVYDETGATLLEEEYRDGKLSMTTRYLYEGGRLVRRREIGPDGRDLAVETFRYAENGRLREVSRRTPEGSVDRSDWVAGWSGVAEQRSLMDGSLYVERYDQDGRLSEREKRVNGTAESVQTFSYAPGGKLASSTERRPADATVIDRAYDAEGRISTETTRVKDAVHDASTWEYDSRGNVVTRTRRGPDGLEVWRYRYTDADKLSREEYTRRGALVEVTLYGDGKLRTEELYRRGELFLKIFYDGETRLREEVYAEGALVRARDYP